MGKADAHALVDVILLVFPYVELGYCFSPAK
jgi:hypothetical protein